MRAAEPSSAPAKVQTSRLNQTLEDSQQGARLIQEAHAPDEIVASLHGEAAVDNQTSTKYTEEGQSAGVQSKECFPQATGFLRKGQEGGTAGRQNRVVFHYGWLSGSGRHSGTLACRLSLRLGLNLCFLLFDLDAFMLLY